MEKIDWQEITEALGEDRWRDDLVILPRQSRLLLAKLVQENRFLSRDSQQIYYGPDSQAELYDAAKTAYNSLNNPLQTDLIDMVINGDLVVNNDDFVVDQSTGRVGIGTAEPESTVEIVTGAVSSTNRSPQIRLGVNPGEYQGLYSLYANTFGLISGADYDGTNWTARDTSFAQYGCVGLDGTHRWYSDTGLTSGDTFTRTERMRVGRGFQVGSPTGGDKGAGTINLPVAYHVNGIPVIQARKTGWSTPTGTASRATFDTATVALESLAQRFKALVDDLIAHGLIGA